MVQIIHDEMVLSENEQARRDFVAQAQVIPQVYVQVGGNTAMDTKIKVVVPDILGPVADQIYALEVQIRRQYRHARLHLEVVERDICDDESS